MRFLILLAALIFPILSHAAWPDTEYPCKDVSAQAEQIMEYRQLSVPMTAIYEYYRTGDNLTDAVTIVLIDGAFQREQKFTESERRTAAKKYADTAYASCVKADLKARR